MTVTRSTWVQRAACLGSAVDLWYPPRGDWKGSAVAVSICQACVVRTLCLEEALRLEGSGDCVGIRGGLTSRERRRLLVDGHGHQDRAETVLDVAV